MTQNSQALDKVNVNLVRKKCQALLSVVALVNSSVVLLADYVSVIPVTIENASVERGAGDLSVLLECVAGLLLCVDV